MDTLKIRKIIYFLRDYFDLIILVIHKLSFKLIQKKFISFALIGFFGGIIDVVFAKILMKNFNLYYPIAILLSILISVILVFFMNNFLTFRDVKFTGQKILKGLLKNIILNSFIIFLRYILVLIFYSFFSYKLFISQIVAIAICFLIRYLVSLKIIWNIS